MNKRRKIEISALLIILSLAGFATSAVIGHAPRAAAVSAAESGSYVLRSLDGRLAVYSSGAREPLLITNIETAGLRDADRELIEAGLVAENHDELLTLLEDLGS